MIVLLVRILSTGIVKTKGLLLSFSFFSKKIILMFGVVFLYLASLPVGCLQGTYAKSKSKSSKSRSKSSKKSRKRTSSGAYKKATRGSDVVVKKKLFPKKRKLEVSFPDVGLILNQSYIESFVLHGNFTYYRSEKWGFGVEGLFAINNDKVERYCIENFYNNPKQVIGVACPLPGQDVDEPLKGGEVPASLGPAYVPIREIGTILAGNAVWTPVYGKQLALMTRTVYLDLFLTFGLGLTFSTFYPQSIFIDGPNGKVQSRKKTYNQEGLESLKRCEESILGGICPPSEAYVGEAGRPEPEDQVSPTITFGVGQKIHFLKRYIFKTEIRNYTLLATEAGFDSFFMMWAGLGMRL